MEVNLTKYEIRLVRKSLTSYIDWLLHIHEYTHVTSKRVIEVRELRIKLRDIVLSRA